MTELSIPDGRERTGRGRAHRLCLFVASVVAAASFAVTLLATLGGVAARYLGISGMEWTFELAGIAFLWTTFVGVIVAEMKGENVAFTAMSDRLRGRARQGLVLFLGVATLWFALELFQSALAFLERSGGAPTPVLRLPRAVSIIPLMGAAAATAAIAVASIVRTLRHHSDGEAK
ncbi:TRAP transporter small permease [Jiella mangrovi]|uniref:TRAP transporter small permease protein n=1 Tax=Jiella mangrovi TaxID=2821407 RepID=A0ABS4BJD9_9HYPH|nr:TRAP transporter small permease subunit [Jiella mangrovi]MBP0616873.1 TRAP transporter small permease subunit [Jiella mangrovi]